jgi:hypothetical protein
MVNDEKELNTLEDLICKADTCSGREECEGGGICHSCKVIASAVTEWFKNNGWIKSSPVDMGEIEKILDDMLVKDAVLFTGFDKENMKKLDSWSTFKQDAHFAIRETAKEQLTSLIQRAIAQALKDRADKMTVIRFNTGGEELTSKGKLIRNSYLKGAEDQLADCKKVMEEK